MSYRRRRDAGGGAGACSWPSSFGLAVGAASAVRDCLVRRPPSQPISVSRLSSRMSSRPARRPREIVSQRQAPGGRRCDRDCTRPDHPRGCLARAGARRHADHRNAAARAFEPVQRLHMVVPVQHEVGAMLREDLHERRRIGEPLVARANARPADDGGARRGTRPPAPSRGKQRGELRQLLRPELAGRHEGRGRQCGRQPDERDGPAAAQERKAGNLRRCPCRRPGASRRMVRGRAHVDVVIAGHQRDAIGRTEAFEPGASAGANSGSSAMLIRSPVTAMWSGAAAFRSAVIASSTSGAMDGVAPQVPVGESEQPLPGEILRRRTGQAGRDGDRKGAPERTSRGCSEPARCR